MNENCFVLSSDLYSPPFEQPEKSQYYFRVVREIEQKFVLLLFIPSDLPFIFRNISLNILYALSGDLLNYILRAVSGNLLSSLLVRQ